jgi:diguanylate cyclase (GGDEF)-like protein
MSEKAEVDVLLDTLGTLLREFGRNAFDIEGVEAAITAQRFDRWAHHALTGAAAPDEEKAVSRTLVGRRWLDLRRDFIEHRQKESQHVLKSLETFRHVLFAFLGGLNRVMSEEVQGDARIKEQASKLEAAVKSNAPEEIRQVALATLATLQETFDRRQKIHQEQVSDLGAKLNEMGEQLETVRRESSMDSLTDLFNRRSLDGHLQESVELSRMTKESVCLLLIDIDHFKGINDRYGHPVGDVVLKRLSSVIVRIFRRRRDFVARYGGEEFAIVARDLSATDAHSLSERLLQTLRDLKIEHEGQEISLTASVGLTMFTPTDSAAEWLARADQALYQAKNEGRNRVVSRLA